MEKKKHGNIDEGERERLSMVGWALFSVTVATSFEMANPSFEDLKYQATRQLSTFRVPSFRKKAPLYFINNLNGSPRKIHV